MLKKKGKRKKNLKKQTMAELKMNW